jgi:hypothetical protein
MNASQHPSLVFGACDISCGTAEGYLRWQRYELRGKKERGKLQEILNLSMDLCELVGATLEYMQGEPSTE